MYEFSFLVDVWLTRVILGPFSVPSFSYTLNGSWLNGTLNLPQPPLHRKSPRNNAFGLEFSKKVAQYYNFTKIIIKKENYAQRLLTFFRKFDKLYFLVTTVLKFALLPYYVRCVELNGVLSSLVDYRIFHC